MGKKDLTEQVENLASQWDEGEYDNLKDAIMDCRDLLDEIPEKEAALREEVQRVLAEATEQAEELADDDPEMEGYLSGLIEPKEIRDARTKPSATKPSATKPSATKPAKKKKAAKK